MILKAASQTQATGRALAEIVSTAVPKDVFQYVNLPGRIAGDALLEGGIDKLCFTGSTEVGRQLMAKAAKTLTPLVLELGGNDAMLVCPDAHLDRASSGAAWAGLQNAGQSCGAVQRIFVHTAVYDQFVEQLAAKVTALRVGPDSGRHGVDVGSMTTREQAEKVRQQVEQAVQLGATVRAQALPPAGASALFLPLTVLTDVNDTMDVVRHETFGPVLCVMPVASMEDAVKRANDCDLALTASVWSRDKRAADALAVQLHAGVVTINDHLMSHALPEVPWGGCKQSGFGRTHGQLGFDEMTRPVAIVHDNMSGLNRNLWWHPHNETLYDGMHGLLDFMHGHGVRRRLHGLSKLLRIVPRYFGR